MFVERCLPIRSGTNSTIIPCCLASCWFFHAYGSSRPRLPFKGITHACCRALHPNGPFQDHASCDDKLQVSTLLAGSATQSKGQGRDNVSGFPPFPCDSLHASCICALSAASATTLLCQHRLQQNKSGHHRHEHNTFMKPVHAMQSFFWRSSAALLGQQHRWSAIFPFRMLGRRPWLADVLGEQLDYVEL